MIEYWGAGIGMWEIHHSHLSAESKDGRNGRRTEEGEGDARRKEGWKELRNEGRKQGRTEGRKKGRSKEARTGGRKQRQKEGRRKA